jgi:nitroreductase
MDVKNAIEKRRAYRSLQKIKITKNIIDKLANAALLAPSCFNNQPWQFIFVYKEEMLEKVFTALSRGNQSWATKASLVIIIFSKKEDDCISKGGKIEREYYLFDTGMATAFMILQATELNLVAHPIAGYSPDELHEILSIPTSYNIINLLIVGKKDPNIKQLSESQRQIELTRPPRKSLNKIVFHNRYMEN